MPGVGETTYYYDFENRLTTINLPTSQLINFTYDGDKRRTSKTVDFTSQTTTTKFFYDGINILKDLDGNGAVKASYVQGIGIDKLISVSYTASSEPSYYHSDALGSVRSLTDDTGTVQAVYAYDAWGSITEQTGTSDNEYKFTSRRWEEEIGLQYNRARFYDPEIGRFTTPDPLTGGPDDPTISYFNGIYSLFHRFIKEHVDSLQPDKQNRYVYCYNNPVNLIDPLGLHSSGLHKAFDNEALKDIFSEEALGIINEANVGTDRAELQGTNPEDANLHGMRGILEDGSIQSTEDAQRMNQQYYDDRINKAVANTMSGNFENALEQLGEALHIKQDPHEHKYEPWRGVFGEKLRDLISHTIEDYRITDQEFKENVELTKQAWEDFQKRFIEECKRNGMSEEEAHAMLGELRNYTPEPEVAEWNEQREPDETQPSAQVQPPE